MGALNYAAEIALFVALVVAFVIYQPPTPDPTPAAASCPSAPSTNTTPPLSFFDAYELPLPKPLVYGVGDAGRHHRDLLYEWAASDIAIDTSAITRGYEEYGGMTVR